RRLSASRAGTLRDRDRTGTSSPRPRPAPPKPPAPRSLRRPIASGQTALNRWPSRLSSRSGSVPSSSPFYGLRNSCLSDPGFPAADLSPASSANLFSKPSSLSNQRFLSFQSTFFLFGRTSLLLRKSPIQFDCTIRQRSDLIEFSHRDDSELVYFSVNQASGEPVLLLPNRHFFQKRRLTNCG